MNHSRRQRFPWSLYHRDLERRLAEAVAGLGAAQPKVLVVGCGLEPFVPGVAGPIYYGADLDESSVSACRKLYPDAADRLAVCPSPYELPTGGGFDVEFDAIVAKEVIEHLEDPERWVRGLAARLAPSGQLLITTPNYSRFSTLALLEGTILELFARRDGYSRRHIHPSRFTRERLAGLVVPGLELMDIQDTWTHWALFARWRKLQRGS